MHTSILKSLSAAWFAGLLLMTPALAEPEAAAETETVEEEDPDEVLVKSLLGQTYSGDLPIEGWTDYGGGLVSPPIYVHLYQREDGTSLVLTSKLASKKYQVIDALMISKPWKGYAISIGCTQGDDFTLRFIGDARGPGEKEWWTEVRRAWEIEVPPKPKPAEEVEAEAEAEPANPGSGTGSEAEEKPEPNPGKIKEANTRGVKCTNPNW
jgi:hypothetical protein